jgi:hypothetical protein
MTEEVSSSETSAISTRLHATTSYKTAISMVELVHDTSRVGLGIRYDKLSVSRLGRLVEKSVLDTAVLFSLAKEF